MSETTVLDKPVTETTETKGDAPDETTLLQAEDVEGKLQTDPDADKGGEAEPAQPDDHLAELEREKAEADKADEETRIQQAIEARERQRQAEAKENARREKIKNAIPNAHAKMTRLLDGLSKHTITDADGDVVQLQPKVFAGIIDGLGLEVEEAVTQKKDAEYNAAWEAGLKTPERITEFWEKAKDLADDDGVVSVSALQDLYTEMTVFESKAFQGMDLDQATKAPKVKKAIADLKLAEYNRGKEDGRKNPYTGGGAVGSGGVDGVSFTNPSYADLQKMTRAQLDALPDGVFEKAMSGKGN